MDTPSDRVQMVWAEAQQLTRYLHALPLAAWHHPSACERWQVGDVVVHLAACAEVYADSICRGRQGDIAPPPEFPPTRWGGGEYSRGPDPQLTGSVRQR